MNIYEVLAYGVDIIHIMIIIYWIGGFFVSTSRHPKFRQIHSILGISMFVAQIINNFKCPLVILSSYLRKLAHPELAGNWPNQPFIAKLLNIIFGFQSSDIVITIITAIGTIWMTVILLKIRKQRKRR
jgi:hypothetical protein